MYKSNTSHLQQNLFGFESHLSDKKRRKLEQSAEAAFYQMIFCAINEDDFSALYSDCTGRPNAPINSLVSSVIMQNKKGWTIEELFDHIDFDLKTRCALGLRDLDETPFCAASYYNFLARVREYHSRTDINLIEMVFDRLTQEQLKRLKLKTSIQRMDSFMVLSNIRQYSRIELLIEVLLRLYGVLSDTEKASMRALVSSYAKRGSSNYVHRLKPGSFPHELERLAAVYHQVYEQFKDSYGEKEIFPLFERVYREHFYTEAGTDTMQVRPSSDMRADSLQSPDDLDATFRRKGEREYQGQVANVAETAHPDNPLNLISDAAVAANTTDDPHFLHNRVDRMKEKTPDLDETHTDGGYGSSENDRKLAALGITHIQTAVRGCDPGVPMTIESSGDTGHTVSCPHQRVRSRRTRTRYKACFDISICRKCTTCGVCPTVFTRKHRVYYFTDEMVARNRRIRAIEKLPLERRTLRANVEATVKEFTPGYNHKGKVRVRGWFGAMLYVFTRAIAINFGRIFRYLMKNPGLATELGLTQWLLTVDTASVKRLVRSVVVFFRILLPKRMKWYSNTLVCHV